MLLTESRPTTGAAAVSTSGGTRRRRTRLVTSVLTSLLGVAVFAAVPWMVGVSWAVVVATLRLVGPAHLAILLGVWAAGLLVHCLVLTGALPGPDRAARAAAQPLRLGRLEPAPARRRGRHGPGLRDVATLGRARRALRVLHPRQQPVERRRQARRRGLPARGRRARRDRLPAGHRRPRPERVCRGVRGPARRRCSSSAPTASAGSWCGSSAGCSHRPRDWQEHARGRASGRPGGRCSRSCRARGRG